MRPEIDEVDRFRDRTDKERKAKSRPATKTGTSSPGSGKLKRGSMQKQTVVETRKTPVFMSLLVFLLLAACGYLGWNGVQQQEQIETLNADLEDAIGFISQSKLLMARLEGDLSETGAEMAQSGTAVEKKLAFLDSEMRKLWGVSNDRNKKAISANADKNTALEQTIKKVESRIKGLNDQTEKTNNSFESLISGNQRELKSLQSQFSLVSGEVSITRDSLEESLGSLDSKLVALEKKLDADSSLEKEVKENAQMLESVNASRKQLNDRVLELTKKVELLQKQLPKPKASAP